MDKLHYSEDYQKEDLKIFLSRKICKKLNLSTVEEVDAKTLIADGIISKEKDGIVILATGKLDKKLSVKASRFTKKAAEAIVAAGGKIEVI